MVKATVRTNKSKAHKIHSQNPLQQLYQRKERAFAAEAATAARRGGGRLIPGLLLDLVVITLAY